MEIINKNPQVIKIYMNMYYGCHFIDTDEDLIDIIDYSSINSNSIIIKTTKKYYKLYRNMHRKYIGDNNEQSHDTIFEYKDNMLKIMNVFSNNASYVEEIIYKNNEKKDINN